MPHPLNGKRGEKMKIAERIFILFMGVFAAVIIKECSKLPIGSEYTIGPGFLPRFIAYAMLLISIMLLVKSFNKNKTDGKGKPFIVKAGFMRLISFFILLLLAVVSVDFVGMFIPLGIFMILIFKFVERYSWLSSVKVSVVSVIVFYFIFKVWLGVPIPGFSF